MTKKQLLLRRGFSEEDIANDFAEYTSDWNISTITKEQVISASDTQQLTKLFSMDSVETKSWCCTYYGYSFDYFAQDITEFRVSPSELDPHIARLCKAVNSIGVKTCMSCDGWHKNEPSGIRCMKLYMTDRYSVIWFWLITEFIFGEYWQHNQPLRYGWSNIWEPFDSEADGIGGQCKRDMMVCMYSINRAEQLFNKQDHYARFIEKHRYEFLALRKQLVTLLYNQMKNNQIDNIDSVNFMKARRYMSEIFVPLAEPLKNAFTEEHYSAFMANDSIRQTAVRTVSKGSTESAKSYTYIDDMMIYGNVLCRYNGHSDKVVIPDGITEIAEEAFKNCTELASLTIPDSVQKIGRSAFTNCSSLWKIIIPKGVKKIPDFAFHGCSRMREVIIPDSVNRIGMLAFDGCSGLLEFNLPKGLKRIDEFAFGYCSSLQTVTIPDSVVKIDKHGFFGCVNLRSVIFPNPETRITETTFNNCPSLDKGFLKAMLK